MSTDKAMIESFLKFAKAYKHDIETDDEGDFISRKTQIAFNGFRNGWEEREAAQWQPLTDESIAHQSAKANAEKLDKIIEALDQYHNDLTHRCHGGLAQDRFVKRCEKALDKFWS